MLRIFIRIADQHYMKLLATGIHGQYINYKQLTNNVNHISSHHFYHKYNQHYSQQSLDPLCDFCHQPKR